MADLTVTAASVLPGAGASIINVTWGGTITAGAAVYKDTADGEWKLADADASGTAGANGVGIALNGGADGQPGRIITAGSNFVVGATVVVGERYYVSNTAGKIMPSGDLSIGEYVTLLFIATTSTVATVSPVVSGVAVP